MKTQTIQFVACTPTPWRGRYATIPGSTATYHLIIRNGRWWPAIYWNTDESELKCHAVESQASNELATAVNRAKMALCRSEGGSFIINEFGEIIVPSLHGNGPRMLAGRLSGKLLFEHPLDFRSNIDLGDCSGLQPGDPWKLPYVGMPFKFTATGQIQFHHKDGDDTVALLPERQDPKLVRDLRMIRPQGGRFIVNHGGLVLTKLTEGRGEHQAVFVGQIDKHFWFAEGRL